MARLRAPGIAVKRFTYTTERRYCPRCGGDGVHPLFPWADCRRCRGEGHLDERPAEGERYIELVHDQSGAVVDIKVVPGNDPPSGTLKYEIVFIAAIVGAIIALVVAF